MPSTLIIASHMDDESLSCSGLIQARKVMGWEVHILVLSGRVYDYGSETVEKALPGELIDFEAAMRVLEVPKSNYRFCNFKEGEPFELGFYQVLREVERSLLDINPYEVVVPSKGDLNQCHRHYAHVSAIALRAANLKGVRRVLQARAFDTDEGFGPYYIPMNADMMQIKFNAVNSYKRERRESPHPRSLENIVAHHRVAGSKCGVEFAESYGVHLIREGL